MKKGWIIPVVAVVAFFAIIFGMNALMNKDSFFIDDYFEVTLNGKKATITWDDAKLEKLNAKLTKKLRSNPDFYRQEANASSKAKEAYLAQIEDGLENGLSVKDLVTIKTSYKKDEESGDYVEVSINTSKSNFLGTVMQQSVCVRNSQIPIRWVKKAQ